jgi:hypothetical protein
MFLFFSPFILIPGSSVECSYRMMKLASSSLLYEGSIQVLNLCASSVMQSGLKEMAAFCQGGKQ